MPYQWLPDDLCRMMSIANAWSIHGKSRAQRNEEWCRTKCCQSIHDEIDPQELQHIQGLLAIGHSRNKCQDEGNKVDGHLELKKLAYVLEDRSAPEDTLHNGPEVVVHDHYVCSFFGHLGACHASQRLSTLDLQTLDWEPERYALLGDMQQLATVTVAGSTI